MAVTVITPFAKQVPAVTLTVTEGVAQSNTGHKTKRNKTINLCKTLFIFIESVLVYYLEKKYQLKISVWSIYGSHSLAVTFTSRFVSGSPLNVKLISIIPFGTGIKGISVEGILTGLCP